MQEPLSQQEKYDLASIKPHGSRLVAKSIKSVMSKLLAQKGYASLQSTSELLEVWQRLVGPPLDTVSRPGNLRAGVLQIHVADNLALQELYFRKKELLEKLQKERPESKVKDLKFRISSLG